MKNLFIIGLVLILSILHFVDEEYLKKEFQEVNPKTTTFSSTYEKIKSSSGYNFQIHYNSKKQKVEVVHHITWINNTNHSTDKIYLSLPLNAFRNSKTSYYSGRKFSNRAQTGYEFKSIMINGKTGSFNYDPDSSNSYDSTLVRIDLEEDLSSGDTLKISMEYSFIIPQGVEGFGFSVGRNFCLLADWHPYVTLFKNGIWQETYFTQFTKPEPEYFNFQGVIKTESDLFISSSAKLTDKSVNVKSFEQSQSKRLSFAIYNSVVTDTLQVDYSNGGKLTVEICMLEENERYLKRVRKVIEHSVEYLTANIGDFPSLNLSVVNVPNKKNFGFHSYSSMVTFYCDLISPEALLNPEYDLARMLSKQYFQNDLSIVDTEDKWISEGIPTYLAGNIMDIYYEDPIVHFTFAGYFPIYGLNLLSYNEIPIIYTLKEFPYEPGLKDISLYYKYINSNPLTDSKFKFEPEYLDANLSVKPSLIIKSVEKSIGQQPILKSLREIYKINHMPGITRSFTGSFEEIEEGKVKSFFNEAFFKSPNFDYKINSIVDQGGGVYEVIASRSGSGTCPASIYLYTDSDTLCTEWNGLARNFKVEFASQGELIAAEIVPHYAGVLDLNNANNSYTVDKMYWGSLSIAMRAFFWFQNALMIFGSIG